jgi:festuclavine dehydrogenase
MTFPQALLPSICPLKLMRYHSFQAAELASAVLGRKITHLKVSHDDSAKFWAKRGLPDYLASSFADMELELAGGHDERLFARPGVWKGKVTVREYFETNKELWAKN